MYGVPKRMKKKAIKFKLKMIAWLIAIILLIAMLSGCITKRGHKLGGGFVRGEDGVYRRPAPTQTIVPAPSPPVKSNPVPMEPTYDPPKTDKILKESAAPTPAPVVVKPQPEKLPPIEVKPRKEINLGLIRIKLPDNDSEESTDDTGNTGSVPNVVVDGTDAIAPTEKTAIKVHWAKLFLFYLNMAVVLCFIYIVYKVIKGHVLWKEPEINKHLKQIKKPRKRRTKKDDS